MPVIPQRRWPYNCCLLTDLAIVFDLRFPVYVLLEIVDWLPEMWRFQHSRKIETLEAVCKSVRSVHESRAQKTPKQRSKKQKMKPA
jgi:hypothetical protein